MHFEILVEDQSGKKALDILIPKLIGTFCQGLASHRGGKIFMGGKNHPAYGCEQ